MTKDLLVAKRYARALFELARELHKDEEIEAELEVISAAMKQEPEIEKFLGHPSLKLDEKRKILTRIYQERNHEIYESLLSFYLILFEKNRFYLIHDIAVEFKKIADEAQGQGTAEIRSATPIKEEAQRVIVNRLERIAGYKITVKNIVDPSLIGGVSIKVKNKVIDDTIVTRIQTLKKELTKIQSI